MKYFPYVNFLTGQEALRNSTINFSAGRQSLVRIPLPQTAYFAPFFIFSQKNPSQNYSTRTLFSTCQKLSAMQVLSKLWPVNASFLFFPTNCLFLYGKFMCMVGTWPLSGKHIHQENNLICDHMFVKFLIMSRFKVIAKIVTKISKIHPESHYPYSANIFH